MQSTSLGPGHHSETSNPRRNINSTCAVAACHSPPGIVYHKFPRDPFLRIAWLKACRRGDRINPFNSSVCGRHFSSDAYIRDLKHELLGLPTREILIKGSIPTLNLSSRDMDKDGVVPCSKRRRKKEILSDTVVENPQSNCYDEEAQILSQDPIGISPYENTIASLEIDNEHVFSPYLLGGKRKDPEHYQSTRQSEVKDATTMTCTYSSMAGHTHTKTTEPHDVKAEIRNLKAKYALSIKQVSTLERKLKRLKREKPASSSSFMNMLEGKFTGFACEIIKNEMMNRDVHHRLYRYSDAVKTFAITTHYYSPSAYKYLRSCLSLPNPRSLRAWSPDFQDVLKQLHEKEGGNTSKD